MEKLRPESVPLYLPEIENPRVPPTLDDRRILLRLTADQSKKPGSSHRPNTHEERNRIFRTPCKGRDPTVTPRHVRQRFADAKPLWSALYHSLTLVDTVAYEYRRIIDLFAIDTMYRVK